MSAAERLMPSEPAAHISAAALAMGLPKLWEMHDETDSAKVKLKSAHPDYRRLERKMTALTCRIEALEEAVLEAPAQNFTDAVAQLIILLPRIADEFDLPCTARTMAGITRLLLPQCGEDFGELIQHYAVHFELELESN